MTVTYKLWQILSSFLFFHLIPFSPTLPPFNKNACLLLNSCLVQSGPGLLYTYLKVYKNFPINFMNVKIFLEGGNIICSHVFDILHKWALISYSSQIGTMDLAFN